MGEEHRAISSTPMAKAIPVGYAVCRLIVYPSAHGSPLSSRILVGAALVTFMMSVIISGAPSSHRCTDAFNRFAGVLAGCSRLPNETNNIAEYGSTAPSGTTPAKCSPTALGQPSTTSPSPTTWLVHRTVWSTERL